MIHRSVAHATFTLEHHYAAARGRVFRAWGDRRARQQWFVATDDAVKDYQIDFRIGGREHSAYHPPGLAPCVYAAQFLDIVPDERIIYSHELLVNDTRVSAAISTAEFRPDGTGTRLIYTEQTAYFDDTPAAGGRIPGTRFLFHRLGHYLETAETA